MAPSLTHARVQTSHPWLRCRNSLACGCTRWTRSHAAQQQAAGGPAACPGSWARLACWVRPSPGWTAPARCMHVPAPPATQPQRRPHACNAVAEQAPCMRRGG
eukprot:366343-Chlamydomonas_euryale.AAC.15